MLIKDLPNIFYVHILSGGTKKIYSTDDTGGRLGKDDKKQKYTAHW